MIRGSVKVDLRKFKYVRGSLQNKGIRIAINKASVPVRNAVVAAAPKDVGNLKSSIRIRSKYYAKSKTWAAIIGPGSSFSRIRKKPKKPKPPKKRKPNKTLRALKKKAAGIKKRAARKLGKEAGKFASRVVKAVGGKRGKKLVKALKEYKKRQPKKVKPPKAKSKKKLKRKRKWNGKPVRPSRYAHLTQWGGSKHKGRHWLDRALARSRGAFESILASALKAEIKALLTK